MIDITNSDNTKDPADVFKISLGSVTIEGIETGITAVDKNIVELARRMKIGIPAPCYRDGQKKGCCCACIVDIDGEQHYACCTKPLHGMNITVRRPDLQELRKQKIQDYIDGKHIGTSCNCCCDDSGCC